MANPIVLQEFAKLLDKNISKVLADHLAPTKLTASYLFGTEKTNRLSEEYFTVGGTPDIPPFSGKVEYLGISPGFWTKIETKEFSAGIQIERRLIDTENERVMKNRQQTLVNALKRTKEKYAASLIGNAFSAAWEFMANDEGVALCGAHLTKSGVPTTTGFTNYGTSALSATSLAAARVTMMKFKDDIGEFIDINPDTLVVPYALYDTALAITGYDPRSGASSELDSTSANNTINTLYKGFKVVPWIYLDTISTSNWFIMDSSKAKDFAIWLDRINYELTTIVDYEIQSIKHILYSAFACGWVDWRFIYGSNV